MSGDLKVTGGDKFKDLGKRMREQGEAGKGLRRELLAEIREASKPLIVEVKAAEAEKLPHAGGFADLVAGDRISVANRMTGNRAGIRLTQKGKNGQVRDLAAMDAGNIRHPTYGHKPWVDQSIEAGIWSNTLSNSEAVAEVREHILAAMESTASKLKE